MVKENLRTKTLRLPNNERIQYTYFNQAMHKNNYRNRINFRWGFIFVFFVVDQNPRNS